MKLKRIIAIVLLLSFVTTFTVEARSTFDNIGRMVGGGFATLIGGTLTYFQIYWPGIPIAMLGVGMATDGAYDQFFRGKNIESDADIGADDLMKDREFRKGIKQWERMMREDMERRRRISRGLPPEPTFMVNMKQLFGIKRAEAGELKQRENIEIGGLEPLQPVGEFISENDGPKRGDSTKRAEKRAAMMERRRERRERMVESRTFDGDHPQSELSKLDLDDDTYDWCTCDPPQGCYATDLVVSFGCTKCMKVNREYARKALQLEQRLIKEGIPARWLGRDAENKARSAGAGK